MNPNSRHQLWSAWTFRVTPGQRVLTNAHEVRENAAPLLRKIFGSVTNIHVTVDTKHRQWVIRLLTEGAHVHDPDYIEFVRQLVLRLFVSGFGVNTRLEVEARLMAGQTKDASPDSQMIIMPFIWPD